MFTEVEESVFSVGVQRGGEERGVSAGFGNSILRGPKITGKFSLPL